MSTRRDVTGIETYSGQFVDLWHPQSYHIRLEDIAVHLSNIGRYNGSTTKFYSVAEHAVRVSHEVPTLGALHHDSHEAYLGDLTAPLKAVLTLQGAAPVLEQIAARLDLAIAWALDFPVESMYVPEVRHADDNVLYRETASLKFSRGVGEHWGQTEPAIPFAGIGWSPARAQRQFLKRHEELSR